MSFAGSSQSRPLVAIQNDRLAIVIRRWAPLGAAEVSKVKLSCLLVRLAQRDLIPKAWKGGKLPARGP